MLNILASVLTWLTQAPAEPVKEQENTWDPIPIDPETQAPMKKKRGFNPSFPAEFEEKFVETQSRGRLPPFGGDENTPAFEEPEAIDLNVPPSSRHSRRPHAPHQPSRGASQHQRHQPPRRYQGPPQSRSHRPPHQGPPHQGPPQRGGYQGPPQGMGHMEPPMDHPGIPQDEFDPQYNQDFEDEGQRPHRSRRQPGARHNERSRGPPHPPTNGGYGPPQGPPIGEGGRYGPPQGPPVGGGGDFAPQGRMPGPAGRAGNSFGKVVF